MSVKNVDGKEEVMIIESKRCPVIYDKFNRFFFCFFFLRTMDLRMKKKNEGGSR